MYQFLCIDANMPPPYLEIHWRDSANGSFEEMDMDEMFDGRDEDMDEDDENEEEDDDDDDEDDDYDEDEDENDDLDVNMEGAGEAAAQQTVFGFADGEGEKKKRTASKGSGGNTKSKRSAQGGDHCQRGSSSSRRPPVAAAAGEMEEENDGLDIQSLSVVEAEFIYNITDEGKPASQEVAEKKRTINLEAFKIIRVIGKGVFSFFYVYILCVFNLFSHRCFSFNFDISIS